MEPSFVTLRPGMFSELSNDLEQYPSGIVIPLDKPYRWTSADAVRKIKFKLQRHFGKKNLKVGHAGTLDPLATGLLLICIGKATKQAQHLQDQRKEYIAEIRLGATTPSYDLEKEIDAHYPWEHITREQIDGILPRFLGEQDQVPPVFSAKLVDGVRAYEYARQGEQIEMKPSRITLYELEVLDYQAPVLTLRIQCSKGTYIRSIARDLGLALGSGGHLINLRRTLSGAMDVEQAVSMEEILNS